MSKPSLRNWGFALSLLITMFALPIASAASTFCAFHHEALNPDEHCCDQIVKNHCLPESNAATIRDSKHHAQTGDRISVEATNNNDCCCLKTGAQQNVLAKQKIQPTQYFYSLNQPPQLDFSFVHLATAIVFFRPSIVYQARSALSYLPARAPPVL